MNSKPLSWYVFIFCLFLFGTAAIIRIHFADTSIKDYLQSEDDWNNYARYAIDICENGLLIKSVPINYLRPAGFLYNYFVASIFYLSYQKPSAVFFVQALLLGITVCLTYLLFKDRLKNKSGLILLGCLILFAFADFFKNYTFMLLSENLAVFTIVLFFFFFDKSLSKKKQSLTFIAGILLGVTVLTRPTILPFSIILLLLVLFCEYVLKRKTIDFLTLFIGFSIIMSFLPLRNYLITSEIYLLPVDGHFLDYMKRMNAVSPFYNLTGFLAYYLKNMWFIIGFLNVADPIYSIRPHWIVMWLGFFGFFFYGFKNYIYKDFLISVVILFILSFLFVLLLIAQIENYGYRMLLPSIFLILGVAVMGFEKMFERIGKKKSTNSD